jgi:hypothetical protein
MVQLAVGRGGVDDCRSCRTMTINRLLLSVGLWALAAATVLGDEPAEPTAKAIQDNSFLIEEAYNQEAGVVQHILFVGHSVDRLAGSDERSWDFAFTQEWPLFSQRHQVSYTIPYASVRGGGAASTDGIGDVLLNYRFQALMETDTRPAFAPRFSLQLPTGDADAGLGDDTVGYLFNLPLSKIVSDRVTLHANVGLGLLPDVEDHTLVNTFVGGSAIYAVTRDFNLMLEAVGQWGQSVEAGKVDHEFEAVISPGFRYALDVGGAQLVGGVGVPLGLTRAAPDYGVIFYLSFEHRFLKE